MGASFQLRTFRVPRGPAWTIAAAFACVLCFVCPARAYVVSANPELEAWVEEMRLLVDRRASAVRHQAQTRLEQARANHDREAEVCALLYLGAGYRRVNQFDTALGLSREGLAIAETIDSPGVLILALRMVSIVHMALGNFATAMEYSQRSLELAEKHHIPLAECAATMIVGSCHDNLGDSERAKPYFERSLALARELKNEDVLYRALSFLGSGERNAGNFAKAREYYTEALKLQEKLDGGIAVTDLREKIAMLDFKEGRPEVALAVLDEIIPARRRISGGRVKLTNSLSHRSEVLQSLGRLDEALADVNEAKGYLDKQGHEGVQMVYERLAAVQEARGDFAAALAAARRAFAENEITSGEAARLRVADLQTRYDVAKKDEELSRLARVSELQAAEAKAASAQLAQGAAELRAKTAELQAKDAEIVHHRTQRLALAGGIFAVLVVSGVIVMTLRAKRRADRRAMEQMEVAQRAAEEADALKTRLLGIASHDLKAPLRTLMHRARKLQAAGASTTVRAEADQIEAESGRMFRLVHELLDVSAIENKGTQLCFEPADLNEFVGRIVANQQSRAEAKGLKLTFRPASGPVLASIDGERLYQSVSNLLDNALKFTPAGRAVDVTVATEGEHVRITVQDQGPGLRPEDFARLFQPFQKLSATPSSGESSTGLGLYIAREWVVQHGGRIEVDSLPGEGTAFIITLARLEESSPPAAVGTAQPVGRGG